MTIDPPLTPQQNTALTSSGLRLTRPRRCLASLLNHPDHPHVTILQARQLLQQMGIHLPPASIYNGLNEFVRVGLARRFDLGGHTVYCLHQRPHQHFVLNGELLDLPEPQPTLSFLPNPPLGKQVDHIDILIHLRDEG